MPLETGVVADNVLQTPNNVAAHTIPKPAQIRAHTTNTSTTYQNTCLRKMYPEPGAVSGYVEGVRNHGQTVFWSFLSRAREIIQRGKP